VELMMKKLKNSKFVIDSAYYEDAGKFNLAGYLIFIHKEDDPEQYTYEMKIQSDRCNPDFIEKENDK
jgi:hypothetical protein